MSFALWFALFFSSPAPAEPVHILRLVVRCAGERAAHDDAAVERLLKKHNRGAQLRTLRFDFPCAADEIAKERARLNLARELTAFTADQPPFDVLCLSLPNADPANSIALYPLGTVVPTGLDSSLSAALEPLRGRGRAHVKILLTAGSSLTGNGFAAAARGRRLLEFVGAESGEFFGLSQAAAYTWWRGIL